MTSELDVIAGRYSELRGKHVFKIPKELVVKEAVYRELLEDYPLMCDSGENKNHCERVYRAAKRLRKQLLDLYEKHGLEFPEDLSRPRKAEQPSAPRNYVARDAPAPGLIGLSNDSDAGKPRNKPAKRRARP